MVTLGGAGLGRMEGGVVTLGGAGLGHVISGGTRVGREREGGVVRPGFVTIPGKPGVVLVLPGGGAMIVVVPRRLVLCASRTGPAERATCVEPENEREPAGVSSVPGPAGRAAAQSMPVSMIARAMSGTASPRMTGYFASAIIAAYSAAAAKMITSSRACSFLSRASRRASSSGSSEILTL